jgi:hypothetical protein
MRRLFLPILFIGIAFFGFRVPSALAYKIEDLTDVPVENDFVLAAGKVELWMDPGDKYTKEIMITNRLGKTMDFKVEVADFKGSRNPEETVVILENEKGPYSLKDYLKPEITEFTLTHGQRMILPVEVSIPSDAEPGGLYGVILVSAHPSLTPAEIEKEKAKGQIQLVSRLGSLFFIRVRGDLIENGFFKELKTDKKYYEKGPISFKLLFENNGNVHLIPYGLIEIYNILGKKVDEIELTPWFALPDSVRSREAKWERGFLFGKYKALVSVNRGYQDTIDQKSINFWVIPWKIILAGLIALSLVIWFFKWLFSKFEIRRKTS